MKPFWFVLAVFVGLSAIVTLSRTFGGREIIPWRTDFSDAREESFKTGKPLLLYFTAEWCGPCRQMKRTTFADPAVEAKLREFVAVKVDVDQNAQLAERFGVSSIPAFHLVDSSGTTRRSSAGYMSSEEFREWIKS